MTAHHLGSLGTCDGEFEVCIFLPVAEEEWEFDKEAVVDVADSSDGMRAGVSVDAAFK